MSEPRVVLITGASSGVGQSTARALSQRGFKVFGASRSAGTAERIPNVEMMTLDVRDDASVQGCVARVLEKKGRIDVLINNAGVEFGGAVEETSLEEVRTQFETNFFGVIRMTRAVLPSMRLQKAGRIISIGSFSGVSSIPYLGVYSASKFALTGYTEALRMELKPFNIHVSITLAAFLNTPMMDKRQVPAVLLEEYDPWRKRAFASIRAQEERGPGPDFVAERIVRILSSKSPRLAYLVGSQARRFTALRWILPAGSFESGKMRNFGL